MILVVDDDPSVRASLKLLLKRQGHVVAEAADPAAALAAVERGGVDLVLQDMNFSRATSGEEGLALLARLRELDPALPVLLMTAWGSIPLAVAGMRSGAADFVTKPWSNAALVESVATALALSGARRRAAAGAAPPARAEIDRLGEFSALVGEEPEWLAVLDLVARVAPTDAPVLVTGESGTGKEAVAEAIHVNSRRQGGPFVKVNVGGLPTTLFESEMFGHVRGAFTDARADRVGRFEAAAGGTLLLDEIGELEPAAQVKLLRVLQDRTFEPLGSSRSRTVDVRVVAATNRDLARAVADGAFREDLFYRLSLITVRLPPLAARRGDVPRLARRFVAELGARYGRPRAALAAGADAWLERQSWPGNVRQLRQTIERALLLTAADSLGAGDLAAAETAGAAGAEPPGAASARTLEEIEREAIRAALARRRGNLARVAADLGLSRQALYRRLEKHGLERPGDAADPATPR